MYLVESTLVIGQQVQQILLADVQLLNQVTRRAILSLHQHRQTVDSHSGPVPSVQIILLIELLGVIQPPVNSSHPRKR
ncbi:hypothetical protein SDC9_105864 [bioreactor metagenome]|uniref:Uncharacterized protein n=1 Tax=bioreactor metagenome TaxID=1076179 RepID=A0A645B0S2_9ZZZZ